MELAAVSLVTSLTLRFNLWPQEDMCRLGKDVVPRPPTHTGAPASLSKPVGIHGRGVTRTMEIPLPFHP